jgi:CRISPR-associated protein Csm4
MTRYTRVRLEPGGPFHFGERGIGLERSAVSLPADSLFSALCMTLAQVAGADAAGGLLRQFAMAEAEGATPPFRLTSLMPYADAVFLLPYPMIGPPLAPGASELRTRKKFKDITWVSEAVFGCLARHDAPVDALHGDKPVTIQSGRIWLTAGQEQDLSRFEAVDQETRAVQRPVLWRTDTRPRVTVDRRTSASAVYAVGSTHFNRAGADKAGLYTVIEWLTADDKLRGQIRSAFIALGHEGIGGKRSNGLGLFTPQFDELAAWAPGPAAGGFFTTLAPYNPRFSEQAVIGPGAHYEIALRRGWLSLSGYTNTRRCSVRMIADGSVLNWPASGEPWGRLVDATPKRVRASGGPTIYRYGLAFPVRIAGAAMAHAHDQGGSP